MTLLDACREVMSKASLDAKYPNGMDANAILYEIRQIYGKDAFPLVSVLDVVGEMRAFYGEGT